MALIKVIGGDFKKKTIAFQNRFKLFDTAGSSYTYDAKSCVENIEKYDQRKSWIGNVNLFRIDFKDGRYVRAEADDAQYKKLLAFVEEHKDNLGPTEPIIMGRGTRYITNISTIMVLCFLGYVAINFIDDKVRNVSPKAQNDVAASESRLDRQVTMDGYYGCQNEEVFDKLVEYVSVGDKEAFNTLLSTAYITGECRSFKVGETIVITDYGIGTSKVRIKGQLAEYYVASEIFSKK